MRVCFLLFALVTLASLPSVAHAHGYCEDDIATKLVVDLEALAKGKAATPDNWGDCVSENIAQNKKLKPRLLAACTTIIAANPDDSDCVVWSVQVGAKKLGEVDLFDKLTKLFPMDPIDSWSGLDIFVTLDDPRALPLVREAWTKAAADKRAATMFERSYRLAVWHHAALALFTKHGTADDAKFLAANLTKIDDKGVRRGMHRAIDAITKREKSAATKPSP